ncbi:PdaC/SigV domain-containing protein [Salinimicrobium sp. GXAS 041]|uniref:DUF3298 and DUF4163 domain-containing protein n=1 Tax=Salinimicrobium sp. GXAS 041 TaxID=3400806 RepID=UPI003C769419
MALNFRHLSLLFLIFTACKSDKKEPENLIFETQTILETTGENCENLEKNCTVISIKFPLATGNSDASREINRELKEEIIQIISPVDGERPASLQELANNFIQDYRKTAADFPQEPTWEAYVDGEIYHESDSLISVGINSEIFRGGAHGYRGLSFLNFSKETGKLYTYEELFTPEFKDYAENVFRENQEIPEGENINSTGFWFENDTFHLPLNIGFKDDKILLAYNAYEVAPYSAGSVYLEIPKAEVESYLKVE